ncbi:YveK family protein [Paenibacillus albus]|uniref:Lipopolysaccharide biosynthesis protein n=1 Tax=Paenibacillus albus TaxID=2495582 RepID=A0A3Q8X9H4_9BACL|nr:Wzz/FepE/Etk N-terminal domain-containing protein [Paenibacillus albus]AZN43472.1 lipopolysaccharide biosynthesis protein [Paenibacillus albus]
MELELRDYIQIIMKRKWMIVAIVLVCSVAAGLYSYFMIQPTYEATTKIVVNRTATDSSVDDSNLINEVNANLRLIDTYKEVIKTPAIMEVVAKQHPEFNLSALDLIKKVKVSSVNNTQVMTLNVQDLSYEKAAQIVNAISVAFKEQIPNIFNVKNVTILNLADLQPLKDPAPVNKKVKLNVMLALVVSLIAAVGIAFLLDYMDDTIKTESDVRRILELPTLGQIARMDGQDDDRKQASMSGKVKAGEVKHVQVGE